jgi:Flp pilus assembly protein TadB
MDPQNTQAQEIRQREKELQEREHALRLRELEAEIYQQPQATEPPISPTRKHSSESALNPRFSQVIKVAKFLGIVIAVVIALQIAKWLAGAILVGGIAWVAYKLLFEKERSKN